MSNYHLLIIQHSQQCFKKGEYLNIKVVIFAMGYSSNTREFLRGNQPENLPFLLKHYTGILQYRFTLRSQLGTVKKKSKV